MSPAGELLGESFKEDALDVFTRGFARKVATYGWSRMNSREDIGHMLNILSHVSPLHRLSVIEGFLKGEYSEFLDIIDIQGALTCAVETYEMLDAEEIVMAEKQKLREKLNAVGRALGQW
jgi:hypothetical protein